MGVKEMKLVVNNRDYDQPKERLVESLGVLPYWVAQAKMIKAPDIVAYLDTCYGWGLHIEPSCSSLLSEAWSF